MRYILATAGLPSYGNHGGAQTCMGIVKGLVNSGHNVSVLSLFDISLTNPYLEHRRDNEQALENLGVDIIYVEYNESEFINITRNKISLLKNALIPNMGDMYPWSKYYKKVDDAIKNIDVDAILCYHFEPLSVFFKNKKTPILAIVGDPSHMPVEAGTKSLELPFSLKKLKYIVFTYLVKKCYVPHMKNMMSSVTACGAFAGHYATWFKENGVNNAKYYQTPMVDPMEGKDWQNERKLNKERNEMPRILLIGDITGTATRIGLKLFGKDTLPYIVEKLGTDGFEVHIIGRGDLDEQLSPYLNKPYVKLRGRVEPAEEEFLRADLLCVPTPVDLGIRVRILTALSYGCPVVAHEANAEGIPELKHGENCLVAKTGKELAINIVNVLIDKKVSDNLEQGGRRLYDSTFRDSVAVNKITSDLISISG